MSTGVEPDASRSETLAERAYRILEEMIVTLELPPGSTLSDAELSQQLGIGRTPIREALQRLAAGHLVEVVARRAILVTRVSIEEQALVLETRRELERLVARRAARLSTPAERAELAGLRQEMLRAVAERDDVAFLRLDARLNDLMAAAARNQFAAAALSPLYAVSRRFWFARQRQTDVRESGELHIALIDAIVAGDEDSAATASDRVNDYALAFLMSAHP